MSYENKVELFYSFACAMSINLNSLQAYTFIFAVKVEKWLIDSTNSKVVSFWFIEKRFWPLRSALHPIFYLCSKVTLLFFSAIYWWENVNDSSKWYRAITGQCKSLFKSVQSFHVTWQNGVKWCFCRKALIRMRRREIPSLMCHIRIFQHYMIY